MPRENHDNTKGKVNSGHAFIRLAVVGYDTLPRDFAIFYNQDHVGLAISDQRNEVVYWWEDLD